MLRKEKRMDRGMKMKVRCRKIEEEERRAKGGGEKRRTEERRKRSFVGVVMEGGSDFGRGQKRGMRRDRKRL